jgi:hypothetical protein
MTSTFWTLLIFSLCLFVPAGTWAWPRGWPCFAVTVAAGVVITVYLKWANPDVIAARVNRHEGTKGWDRWLVGSLIAPGSTPRLRLSLPDHRRPVPCVGLVLGDDPRSSDLPSVRRADGLRGPDAAGGTAGI